MAYNPIVRSEEFATQLAALDHRLATIETLLKSVYGDHCLGGGKRPDAPQPEPAPPRTRPVATFGLTGANGFIR